MRKQLNQVVLLLCVAGLLCFILPHGSALASQAVFTIGSSSYEVDGTTYFMGAAPYLKDGRVYVPVRYVATACGINDDNVSFDAGTMTVTLKKNDGKEVKMTVGSRDLFVDGAVTNMDAAPEIADNRTYLPLRYVAQAFGQSINWDGELQKVTITGVSGVSNIPKELTPADSMTINAIEDKLAQKDYYGAVSDCDKLIAANPTLIRAYLDRAYAYILIGEKDKAIADTNKVIEMDPKNPNAFTLRARAEYRIYVNQGGSKDSIIADINKSIEVAEPNEKHIFYTNGAALYIRLKNFSKAVESASKAIELNPTYAGGYLQRGIAYFNQGNREKSMEDFKKVLEINPNHEFAKSVYTKMSKGESDFTLQPYDW